MPKEKDDIIQENKDLRARITELKGTLAAIRTGEVDTGAGEQTYSLSAAETSCRILIEQMNEGAAILSNEGIILYCNKEFSELMNAHME